MSKERIVLNEDGINVENAVVLNEDDVIDTPMNEDEMINGLLTAANYKDDEDLQRKIQIKRKGKLLFEFWIRPLTEEESYNCRKKVTKRITDPRGKMFGKVNGETDVVKLRSYIILTATVDKGNGIIWDNKKLKDKLNLIQAVDVIDTVLMSGEKDKICDIIDEISGFGVYEESTPEEAAKN